MRVYATVLGMFEVMIVVVQVGMVGRLGKRLQSERKEN